MICLYFIYNFFHVGALIVSYSTLLPRLLKCPLIYCVFLGINWEWHVLTLAWHARNCTRAHTNIHTHTRTFIRCPTPVLACLRECCSPSASAASFGWQPSCAPFCRTPSLAATPGASHLCRPQRGRSSKRATRLLGACLCVVDCTCMFCRRSIIF